MNSDAGMASEAPGAGVVGRLAPSPTGVLHLGNARTFLLTWLDARARGGTLLLRVEDIDGPRVKPEAEAQALDDLRWLGLDWDGPLLRQSEHQARYACLVDDLLARGLAYPCVCTRKEVEEAASAPHEAWMDATPYPGTCRGRWRTREAALQETGREPAVRFRVEVDSVPFVDRFRGAENGAIAGDFVIEKRDRGPAYQLAVVADDARQGVTDVVRGDDLIPSTPRQLLLYDALGRSAPAFAHLPLLVGPDGRRLAKRHGDTSLRHFRELGVSPERLVGHLAAVSGLAPPGALRRPADLLGDFDLGHVPRQPVVDVGADLVP
jgi:glutamyl-tRNA synthetase